MNPRCPTRHIIYVHGFDRRSPRFFNLWQRRGARTYRARHGEAPEIGPLDGSSWHVTGKKIETTFEVFDWSDLIRDRFAAPFGVGLGAMTTLGITALRQNMIGQVFARDRSMGLMMLWTFGPLFLLAIALVPSAFAGALAFLLVLGLGLTVFWGLHRYDIRAGVFHAAHIAWAARRMACRDHESLEARVAQFRTRLSQTKADEIILIGHSLGAALALRLIEDAPKGTKFLTIGQSIPLVSLQREATSERQIMDRLRDGNLVWIDLSAAKDVLGFFGYDPSGGGAICHSARFGRSFESADLNALKWQPFELHFLYLSVVDQKGGAWDWFAFLNEATPLEVRFSGQPLTGNGERRRAKSTD